MSWAENEKLDEWIQRAYENGKREEQERIIKLLEENAHTEELLSVGFYEPEPIIYLSTAIALIKGENK
jgi:hypothetical protein